MEKNRSALEAKKGETPLPFPYPRMLEEVIADFRAQLLDVWESEKPEGLQPEVLSALDALKRSALEFEMGAVENWTPTRCSTGADYQSFFVLVGRDRTGRELVRAALGRDGQLATWAHPKEGEGRTGLQPLARVKAAEDLLGRVLEAPATSLQLVALDGVNLRCPVLEPCVSGRSSDGSTALVARDGRAYLVDLQEPPIPVVETGVSGSLGKFEHEVKAGSLALVTVGADMLVPARPWRDHP